LWSYQYVLRQTAHRLETSTTFAGGGVTDNDDETALAQASTQVVVEVTRHICRNSLGQGSPVRIRGAGFDRSRWMDAKYGSVSHLADLREPSAWKYQTAIPVAWRSSVIDVLPRQTG
jgi:hypothetical protein